MSTTGVVTLGDMGLGARTEAERKRRNWTQQQLCDLVPGLEQQALDRLEKRDSKRSSFALGIADALKVSVRWLLSGEDHLPELPTPHPPEDALAPPGPPSGHQVTLAQALGVLGQALAMDMPADQRAELAEALSAWARYAGRDRYRETVGELLAAPPAPPEKRRASG